MLDTSESDLKPRGSGNPFEKSTIEKILRLSFSENNHVRLLPSGRETFQTILDSVSGATDIICIEIYLFKDDNTGNKLAALLKEKAGQGIKVYILYDHFGSFGTSKEFWLELKKAGVKVRASHPFNWLEPRSYQHRNHKKLFVIDGHIAFTGGFNIADEYHRYFKRWRQAWRDTGIYLKGPIAFTLLHMFIKSWETRKGEPISWEKQTQPEKDGVSVIPVFTRSSRDRKKARNLLLYSINKTKNKIFITNAYFTPGSRIITALENAVKRGVDVKLLLPGKSDVLSVYLAGRSYYKKLLAAGVEIYNYQDIILHAKTSVFDHCWSIIGSANLDFQSLRRNDEGNVGIFDAGFGRQMTSVFLEDLQRSVRIDAETWPNRPFYEKVMEKFFYLFRKFL